MGKSKDATSGAKSKKKELLPDEPIALDDKKNKKKKIRDVVAVAVVDEEPKKKKKKKEHSIDNETAIQDNMDLTEDTQPIPAHAEASETSSKKPKDRSKKRQKQPEETPPESVPPAVSSTDSPHKGKIKKRKLRELQQAEQSEENASNLEPSPPPKKKRKNNTGFPDPRSDELLSNQACKALEYAFAQFNKPTKWKFNKARQNWILRNVFSKETVPDTYLPLLTKYLSQVKGGSRQKLKQTCTSIIEEVIASAKPDPPADSTSTTTPTPTAPAKAAVPTLTSILKKPQPTPGPLISVDTPTIPSTEAETIKEPLVDHRRIRAQAIIDALAASVAEK